MLFELSFVIKIISFVFVFVPVWFCVVKTMLFKLSFEWKCFETHSDSPQCGRSLNRRASKQSQGLPSCLLGTLGGEPGFDNIFLV